MCGQGGVEWVRLRESDSQGHIAGQNLRAWKGPSEC